jgi:PAS domain S-box-containing protein
MRNQSSVKHLESRLDQLNKLIEASGDGLFVTDFETAEILYVNNKACESLGYSKDELLSMTLDHIDPVFVCEKMKKKLWCKMVEGKTYTIEVAHKRKDGSLIPIELRTALVDYEGKKAVLGYARDISERKKSELELKKLSTVVNQSANAIIITNTEGNIEYVNPVFTKLTGYTFEEVKGKNPRILNAGTQDKEYYTHLWNTIASGKIWKGEFHNKTKSGDLFWELATISPIKSEAGEIINFLAVKEDITKRKLARMALKESEERFRTLSNLTFEGILVHENGIAIDLNLSFAKMFGYKRKELLGKNMIDLLIHKNYHELIFENIIKKHTEPYFAEGIRKEGKRIPLEIEAKTVKANNNKSIRVATLRDISHRLLLEDNLKKSEKRFRQLFEKSGDAILIIEDRKFVDCNLATIHMLKYNNKEEFLNVHPSVLSPEFQEDGESSVSKAEKMMNLAVKNGTHRFQWNHLRKNGDVFPVEVLLTAMPQDSEKEVIHCVWRDITDKKMTLTALRESEEFFSAIAKQSSEGITVADHDGNYVMVNPAFCKMSGYTEEELLKLTVFDMKAKNQSHDSFFKSKAEMAGKPLRVNLVTKSGKEYMTEIIGQNIVIGGKKLVLGTIRDITKQIISENKLKQSEEKFKNAFLTSPDSININRLADGLYISINQGFTALTGFTEKDVIGKTSLEIDIWENPKDREILLDELKRNGKVENLHARFRMKDGSFKDALMSASITKINDVPHIISITRDISERISMEKKLELLNKHLAAQNEEYISLNEELKESFVNIQKINKALKEEKIKAQESDRLKSAFLANMSHEIRTPMNGILGFTNLLKNPKLEGSMVQQYVEIIQKSSNRMLSTINDLMDISKIEAGQVDVLYSETNINTILIDLFSFFNKEATDKGLHLSLTNKLSPQDAEIISDEEKVNAIITNLIKNSIKYTNQGSIEFGCYKKENHVVFYVKDTGVGIPEDRHEAIFDRFVQADIEDTQVYEGSGLGLSISKAYVEMMKGRIWVESKEGIGSTFYFKLPFKRSIRDDNLQETDKTDTVGIKSTSRKLKILIVEDEEISDNLITIILKEYSDNLIHAKNGVQAIEICKQHKDIDLIFMDIRMPKLGGYQATKEIRKFNKKVKIIAQTAYALSGDREKALAIGCDDYIAKPIIADELKLIINKHLFDLN